MPRPALTSVKGKPMIPPGGITYRELVADIEADLFSERLAGVTADNIEATCQEQALRAPTMASSDPPPVAGTKAR